MSRLLEYLRSLPHPPGAGKVVVTADGIEGFEGADRAWQISWTAIRRIGYVREESGLGHAEDRFLGLQTEDALTLISLAVEGAASLSRRIPTRFSCVFGERGDLGHVTADDAVVVWPAEEAEKNLLELAGKGKVRFLAGLQWGFRGEGPKRTEEKGLVNP